MEILAVPLVKGKNGGREEIPALEWVQQVYDNKIILG